MIISNKPVLKAAFVTIHGLWRSQRNLPEGLKLDTHLKWGLLIRKKLLYRNNLYSGRFTALYIF